VSGGKTGVCRFFRKAELQSHGGKTSEVELSVDGVSRSDPDGHPECKYKNQHKPEIRNERDINNILTKDCVLVLILRKLLAKKTTS